MKTSRWTRGSHRLNRMRVAFHRTQGRRGAGDATEGVSCSRATSCAVRCAFATPSRVHVVVGALGCLHVHVATWLSSPSSRTNPHEPSRCNVSVSGPTASPLQRAPFPLLSPAIERHRPVATSRSFHPLQRSLSLSIPEVAFPLQRAPHPIRCNVPSSPQSPDAHPVATFRSLHPLQRFLLRSPSDEAFPLQRLEGWVGAQSTHRDLWVGWTWCGRKEITT